MPFYYKYSYFIAQLSVFPGVDNCLGFRIVYLIGSVFPSTTSSGYFPLPSQCVPTQKVSEEFISVESVPGPWALTAVTPHHPVNSLWFSLMVACHFLEATCPSFWCGLLVSTVVNTPLKGSTEGTCFETSYVWKYFHFYFSPFLGVWHRCPGWK